MEIVTTQSNGCIEITLRDIVKHRINYALNKFRDNIQRIHVRFGDSNGPEGKVGVRCDIFVNLVAHGVIVVKGNSLDAFSAFNHCIEKIVKTMKRKTAKERDLLIKSKRQKHRLIPHSF